jgi:Xaa-Pro aminopeptidase
VTDTDAASEPDVSADNPISENWVWVGAHRPPCPRALFDQMTKDWAPEEFDDSVHAAAAHCEQRRVALAERFAGRTIVVPTGNFKTRSNDVSYRFRPGTDFYYLTGCFESDAVLVMTPEDDGHRATIYVPERRDESTHQFFTDAGYGELWVGPRRGVKEAAAYYDVDAAPLDRLTEDLAGLTPGEAVTLRGLDRSIDEMLSPNELDSQLAESLSEQRLVKDAFEVAQLQQAVDLTIKGFEDVVRSLPQAVGRTERVIEGVFNLRARLDGNDVGYDTIAASGSHATILHWTHNDGEVRDGDLLLLDAGVECHELYTADVTRTMPVSGKFSPTQRRIYDLVLAAADAAIAEVRPGVSFRAPHNAAMEVLAKGLHELGILTVDPEEALRPDQQLHRRYTLHGVSHMLGLDVHDCANARDEAYNGELEEGYVITIEPGLYFQSRDLTVPEEYRGIGVRIEDDVLVTADGARVLSAALPRNGDEIEAWMARLLAEGRSGIRI